MNAADRGWAFDRLADLARVLRVPGTSNCKDPQNPKPVRILSQTDNRYNPSDFLDLLDDLDIPGTEEQDEASRKWQEKFADTPLVIDPDAKVPAELLDRHLTSNTRFKETWLRQRS